MGLRVSEQFVESKSDGRDCEDLIVVSEHFAAVIDGASDETGVVFDRKTGGRFAAEVIAETISGLALTADARVFADSLARALGAAVKTAVGDLAEDVRRPAASVACASAHRREVWRIGDCNVLIGGTEHAGGKRVDDAAYGFRAAVNAALTAKGVSQEQLLRDDPGAKAARPLFDNQQHLANVVGPWGYGCVNGRAVPDDYLEVMPIPDGPMEVVITSDGYPVVHSTLSESEATLAGMVARDPAGIGELWSVGKSTKPGANAPDDRAYLRFVVE